MTYTGHAHINRPIEPQYSTPTIWAATAAVVIALGALAVYSAQKQPQGYVGRADQELAPLRQQFETVCKSEGDSPQKKSKLLDIVDQRNKYLQSSGLEQGCEKWHCSDPEDGAMYFVNFKPVKTCDYHQKIRNK